MFWTTFFMGALVGVTVTLAVLQVAIAIWYYTQCKKENEEE